MDNVNPITRTEMFLKAAIDGKDCGLVPITRKEMFLKELSECVAGGGGGTPSGGGGVSSWNDLTDKPFYAEASEEVIADNVTVELVKEGGEPYTNSAVEGVLYAASVGHYVVTWNGEDYECDCVETEGAFALGNTIMVDGSDNGCPFLFVSQLEENFTGIIDFTGGTSCTFTIKKVEETIKPLDEKYLPDSVKALLNIVNGSEVAW